MAKGRVCLLIYFFCFNRC